MSTIQVDERPVGRRISRALTSPVVEAERLRKLSAAQSKQGHTSQTTSDKKMNYSGALYGIVLLLGIAMYLSGRHFLQAAVLVVGYITVSVCLFLATSLLYAWWGAKNMETSQFDTRKCIYCYLSNISGEFASCLVVWFLPTPLKVPGIGLDPIDLLTFTTLVLLIFCMFVNNGGLDAVFSNEALYFVLLGVVLRYANSVIFDSVIPNFLTSLVSHNGVLLGLTIMLWKHRHPNAALLQLLNFPLGSNAPVLINTSPSYSSQSSRRNSISSTTSRSSARLSRSSWSTYTSRNSSVSHKL